MKILLVRPGYENLFANINIVNVEPLELEYLYTVGKEEGFQCHIYDAVIDKRAYKEVLKEVNPDYIALTGYITQRDLIIDYANLAKVYDPSVTIIVGGVHAELNYQDFFHSSVDFIVHSGGITPFRELISPRKTPQDLNRIKGICFRLKDNSWQVNDRLLVDPNSLPIPDRSFFYQNKDHFKYINLSPCAVIKTAYSCPYDCNFCYCCQLNQGTYVAREVEKVVEEIAGIDCDNLWILDDTFYVSEEKVNIFVNLLKERNISKNLIVYYRADFIANNEDLIAKLKTVGLKVVLVGLESFDDRQLKDYEKLTSKEINEKALEVLKKYDIECTGLFIVDIDATKKDFKNLRNYIKKHNLKVSTAAILTPLPGTYQFEKYKDRINTSNPRHWDFLHLVAEPKNMTKVQYYYEFYKFYLKLLLINQKSSTLELSYIFYIKGLAKTYIKNLLAKIPR